MRFVPCVPRYVSVHGQRCRQIALHRCLPVVRRTDGEVRIDRERVAETGCGCDEAPGQRQRIRRAVRDGERRRERRLLREQRRDRLIHVGVPIDAVRGAYDERRPGNRTPRQRESWLDAALVRLHQRTRIRLARHRAGRARRQHLLCGAEVGCDIEIHQTFLRLGQRSLVFPAHAGRHGERRSDAPVVSDVGVVREAAEVLVGVAERNRRRRRHCRAGSRQNRGQSRRR